MFTIQPRQFSCSTDRFEINKDMLIAQASIKRDREIISQVLRDYSRAKVEIEMFIPLCCFSGWNFSHKAGAPISGTEFKFSKLTRDWQTASWLPLVEGLINPDNYVYLIATVFKKFQERTKFVAAECSRVTLPVFSENTWIENENI